MISMDDWLTRSQSLPNSSTLPLRIVGLVVASAAVVILTGCQQRTTDKAIDVVGIWKATSGGVFLEFREDGKFSGSTNFNSLTTDPLWFGGYEMVDKVLTYDTSDESRNCPGIIGTYELELTEEGELKQASIDDACTDRRRSFSTERWSPYSP